MRVRLALATALIASLAVAAGCGGGSSSGGSPSGGNGSSGPKLPQKIGPLEGQLNPIAWQGYTEPDGVKPFEQQTGCQVKAKYAGSSDQMVSLMSGGGGGQYDLVSASGDASLRLIYGID